jgi:LmbE family N-acetylglucosaminyl deacetylase
MLFIQKKYIYIISILFFFVVSVPLSSQNSNLTLMCVAAHPDDEDGATLAYYSLVKDYKVYTVFYTRGEGGQNETGPELDSALGKIREQECYNAAKIQGSTPYFLGFLDFGFSKTAKETFKFWGGKDSVLKRIVYMIRMIRPDVVITNHDTITTKPYRQHGNHQAAGITIYEAFDKAADPTYHPEQLVNGVEPWQIKKLYFRVFDSTATGDIVIIDVNQKAPNGKTIGEIAFDALSQHRTQGMDKLTPETAPWAFGNRRYMLVRSDKDYPYDKNDLFSGLQPHAASPFITELISFPTKYNYYMLNPSDSLAILQSLKVSHNADISLVYSYDNTIENTLKAFDIKSDTLSSQMLESADLKKYSVIIIDIRAYLYRKDLAEYNYRILDFVKNGGNVICFYQKPQDWNGKDYAPYPIYITSLRVTEEDAPVKMLMPDDWLFNRPNHVGPGDWGGWVQERNIYLPSGDTVLTSPKYKRMLAMSDEDDTVPSTSLLWTDYGVGTYTYCSLALYRQLKIFNEGALKLFLNMISQPRRMIKGKYN